MNQIQAKYEKSEYSNEPHLTINVDGKPLDKILHELYPDKNLIGLVPTLLDWLWSRIGLDFSKFENNSSESIGTSVEWFDKIEPLEFDTTEYQKFASEFKTEIEKDEIKRLISFWINRIDDKEVISKSVKAFNFGIIETEDDYQTYLVGTNNYDTENDDWACEEDFTPKEKYLSLGVDSKKWKWKEIQSIVKNGIEEFIETRISPLTFVHKAEYLTTGFDDGELLKIEQKVHNNVYN